jgi:uncharacterized protein (DUF983 family)
MPSKSLLNAILSGRCPHCRTGKMFNHPPLSLHFAEMNRVCPHCGVSFMPEPGFYIGAMYISYAFNVGLLIAIGIFLYVFTDSPDWVFVVSIIAASFAFIPFSFRYSRIIFLHAFGGLKYDPERSR